MRTAVLACLLALLAAAEARAQSMADQPYKIQVTSELARRESLLKEQEKILVDEEKKLKKLHDELLKTAKQPPPEEKPKGGKKEPSPVMVQSRAYEQQTYKVSVARNEVMATRRDIQNLREVLARTQ